MTFRKVIDISPPLKEGMVTYPGDVEFEATPLCTIERSGCNMARLHLGTHTGSHIDAPLHFLAEGASIDEIPLERFIGPAQVIEIKGKEISSKEIGEGLEEGMKRVIFKTANSSLMEREEFSREYVYLTEEGAEFLVERGVELVGIDYLSIERFGTPSFSVHKRLFSAGICVLEGLNLKGVNPGRYLLVALPLRLVGLDGSPVRAVLIEE